MSVTPDLVELIAHGDEYPVIDRVLDDHGLVTFALGHDLVDAHAEGGVTIRQLASLTGLSAGTAYDLLEARYDAQDLDGDPSPTTYTPADVDEADGTLQDELRDE